MLKTLLSAILLSSPETLAVTCDSLSKLSLPGSAITHVETVAAGGFAQAGLNPRQGAILPAFCRVAATLKPSSGSEIKMELWMPAANWNGKFMGVGNGGWSGVIGYPALAVPKRVVV